MVAGAAGIRREVRAAVVVGVAVLLISVLGGVAWGWLAPTEQLLVTQPGRGSTLTGESMHQFDALAIFVCIGAVTGVLSAVGAWRWRAVRGPILQLGLLIGSLAGAFAMSLVGEQITRWQHPRVTDPSIGQIVVLPTEVSSWLALIVQPLLASLVVLFVAALYPSDDLGTGFSGPFGESRPVDNRSFAAASVYRPYAAGHAGNGAVPYGGYEPAGEAGSGSMPESRPRY
ncbi:DUF2567 domain-containing protein [Nocardia sp. GCM10030253]|uniref:DUF2567 domain-containing protein n=1 Tax=Nocardia sp. GCM10030253 TaxID=3273404 RepID=UPI003630B7E2